MPNNTPCVLIIRDGWGQNPNLEHDAFNAIKLARTPVADALMREYPTTLIKTSGLDVGLPHATMGNSEVGHQNIGAGRVVDQESVRITKSCQNGELNRVDVLTKAISRARNTDRAVHLMGICSDAGVHGLLEHLYALVAMCKDVGCTRVALHLFTDGRDTGPYSGLGYVKDVQAKLREIGVGRIASLIGRYWAMDRDHRWERVHRAYACLTGVDAEAQRVARAADPIEAMQHHYDHPESDGLKGDEFTPPTIIARDDADAQSLRVNDGDSIIFYNYRGDRPREIVGAFVLPDKRWNVVQPSPETGRRGFDRGKKLGLDFVTMTSYAEHLLEGDVKVAFPRPPRMANILGEYLRDRTLPELRCAETEKFPHVTYFFNDYRDGPFDGEKRIICPSPTDVATYDMKPEMSAHAIRDEVLARLAAPDREPVMILNFANGDMVGHTGVLDAAVRACETVDQCVGTIVERTRSLGGSLIVTADHGNAEQMWDPKSNAPHTAHTTYDVPLIVVSESHKHRTLRDGNERGRLADIAPTMLDIMGLEQPPEMTGESLLVK